MAVIGEIMEHVHICTLCDRNQVLGIPKLEVM
jgi:hypothetical protein